MATFIVKPHLELAATLQLSHNEVKALHLLTQFGVDKVQEAFTKQFSRDFGEGATGDGFRSFLLSCAQLSGSVHLAGEVDRVVSGEKIITNRPPPPPIK